MDEQPAVVVKIGESYREETMSNSIKKSMRKADKMSLLFMGPVIYYSNDSQVNPEVIDKVSIGGQSSKLQKKDALTLVPHEISMVGMMIPNTR